VHQRTELTSRFAVIDESRNVDLSIAAVIPLYNGAKWIEQAIGSILSQTLLPDELIVVDDGSTDDGPNIVARLAVDNPLIKLLHKPNGGQSSARNFGVSHSESRLIALLDQDDIWYRHHLEQLVRPFRRRRGIPLGWVWSDLDEIDETGGLINRRFLRRMDKNESKTSLAQCLKGDMWVLPSAALISREAFEKVGGFDERLSGYEDDDLFLRIFRAGYDNVFLDEPLSQWRIYPSSTSYTTRMRKSRTIYVQKLLDSFPDVQLHDRNFARDYIAPRFMRTLLLEYYRAVIRKDSEDVQHTVKCISTLLPHLALPTRLVLRPLANPTVFPPLFRFAASALPYAPLKALGKLVVH
jgi:glycosyltransferase involved in cell wall biosynthesis